MIAYLRKLVERLQAPGIKGAAGMRLERQCQRDLQQYFDILYAKLPIERLSQLANTQHKESALHAAELQIRRVLRTIRPHLVNILATNMMLAWKQGYEHADLGTFHESHGTDYLGKTGQRAADYAATESAELVKGLDETTLDLIQDAIAEGIDEMLGVGGTARLIRDAVEGMSTYRAEMIASTEMNRAMSTASLEKMSDIGVEYKRWIPAGACCDACADNEAQGAIPVDESFGSGDDSPPAHPNCRCAVVGSRAPED